MFLLKFIYKRIDPERLIPPRGWRAVAALAIQTALLFAMTILLINLYSKSNNKRKVYREKFKESIGLVHEFGNLDKHLNVYYESVGWVILNNDTLALQRMRNEQIAISESLEKLDTLVGETSKPILGQIQGSIDSIFAGSVLAVKILPLQGQKAAITTLAKIKSYHNIPDLSQQLMSAEMETLYAQVESNIKATSFPFKATLFFVSLLASIVFILLSFTMALTVRRFMRDRREHNNVIKKHVETVAFTQNILNILPVGYHSAAKDGTILDMNQTELDWLGYTREEMIGVKTGIELFDLEIHDQGSKFVEFKNKLIQEGHLTNIEGTMIAKDGQRIPVLLNSKAIYDHQGNYTHNVTIIYNYTERKKLEQDLLDAHKDADNAHQFKKLFMANMSHEIRTPLNAILGFAHFLGRAELPPDLKEFVRGIQISGVNLLEIVNDILDFEKIRSGMLRIENIEFDLPGLLHSVVTMVRPSAEEKGLDLIFEPDPELPALLVGDPMRLTQILINLLSNAIKFTETGHVRLRVKAFSEALPDEKIKVRFEVEDTGIGIDPSDHQRIFERFVQAANDTTRKFGGTGLGLALVKMMVDLQNGSTTIMSALGQGSTFTVEIPYQIMSNGISSIAIDSVVQNPLPDLSGYHVLLVEDNPMNRRIAELSLKQFGLLVTHAEDGLEAIAHLKETPQAFDLIIMDIQMPKMDGYAATHAIRNELKLIHVPIVAMTAHVLTGEREKVLASGMNDYLTKPVNQKELATILQKYIGNFWDVQAVHSFVGNKAENFLEIAQLFIRQFPEELANLYTCLLKDDLKAVVDTAHNLRSTVGYAGFQKSLGATLLQLEEEARKKFPDQALLMKLYTSIAENKEKAISILEHEMQKLTENKPIKNELMQIMLADDDQDDFMLFKIALEELDISTQLTAVHNGEQLMKWLNNNEDTLPDILFLDLNMHRKNGFECLGEIKQDERFKRIPVVIYSTSYQKEVVDMLYNYGAYHYIKKANDFTFGKKAIRQAIVSITQNNLIQAPREHFILSSEP